MNTSSLIFRQLFDPGTSTYTYLLGDCEGREAILIDPVVDWVDRDLQLVEELKLKLRYVLDTHVHADHVTGSGLVRERTSAQTVTSKQAGVVCSSLQVSHGDTLRFGRFEVEVRSTPGHTPGCLSFVVRDAGRTLAFTGDALLIRGTGRTDFQGGSAAQLYQSIHDNLFSLPDETLVYPGHDYRGHHCSTIAEEREFNPRLKAGIDRDQFVRIMAELRLASPRHIDVAVPANLACGRAPEAVVRQESEPAPRGESL